MVFLFSPPVTGTARYDRIVLFRTPRAFSDFLADY
jgi:hypothetical protein